MKKTVEIRIGSVDDYIKDVGDIIGNPKNAGKHPDKVIYVQDYEMLEKFLNNRKIELAHFVANNKKSTINSIARKLKRKQEAISQDLKTLQSHGLIKLKKVGRNVYPTATYKKIVINLAG
ncbi:MAG: hypothetical protein ABH821_01850 [archaeon]